MRVFGSVGRSVGRLYGAELDLGGRAGGARAGATATRVLYNVYSGVILLLQDTVFPARKSYGGTGLQYIHVA